MSEADQEPAISPLRIAIFRNVWIASIISNFGALIQSVAAAWTMTSLTRSPTMVALVQASATLPIMLFALLAGAVADNLDRRRVMTACQAYMLGISVVLVSCTFAGLLTPWLLLTLTFLLGCGVALIAPSWAASVGDMVPRASLPAAIGLNAMGFNTARSLGPAIGGLIVATAGAGVAFAVNMLSYVGILSVLLRWRPERAAGKTLPSEGLGAALATGLRYVGMSPRLRVVMIRAFFFGLFANAPAAMMPIIARELVHGGASTYGFLLGAFGVGAVLGAGLTPWLRRRRSAEIVIRGSIVAVAAGTAIAAASHLAVLTAAALLLAGAGWILALSSFNVIVQLAAPRWVVGRALSCYQMAAFGSMAIGSWLTGTLAGHAGVSTALLIVAGAQAAGLILGLLMPLPEVGDMDLNPHGMWTVPDIDADIDPRSGPVVITISYEIAPADLDAFLIVMNERRRIRRRDGARHWRLMRDMSHERLWIEQYEVRTWLDYIRHNQRLTNADAANSEQLLALHSGAERPKVIRMLERGAGAPVGRRNDANVDLTVPLTDPNIPG